MGRGAQNRGESPRLSPSGCGPAGRPQGRGRYTHLPAPFPPWEVLAVFDRLQRSRHTGFAALCRTGRCRRARRGARALLGLGVLAAVTAWAASVRVGTPVRGFPSPGDYPEGLAFDGQFLWSNNYSDGVLYKVDPATGQTLGAYSGGGLPTHPEGLAWDGSFLWTVDHFDSTISKLRVTATGVEIAAQFQIPLGSGPPVGLEWDGTHLWLACFGLVGEKSELYRLNAVTLEPDLVHRLPVWWVEDLAWDGHLLWSCDWIFGLGFAIDPATGDTLHTYRPPGRHPVGQAWDGQYLWVSDTEKDSLWALDISAARTSSVRATSWSQMKARYRGR